MISQYWISIKTAWSAYEQASYWQSIWHE